VRVLHLRPRFRSEQPALAPRGTPAWLAVARALRELSEDRVLPGPSDEPVDLPPFVVGRAVPGTDLLVCYFPAGEEVYVLALHRRGHEPSSR